MQSGHVSAGDSSAINPYFSQTFVDTHVDSIQLAGLLLILELQSVSNPLYFSAFQSSEAMTVELIIFEILT